MSRIKLNTGAAPRSRAALITLMVILAVLLLGARSIASYAIEVAWWKELGQFDTWLSMLYYSFAPLATATLVAFGVLVARARARPQVRRHVPAASTGCTRAFPRWRCCCWAT